MTKTKITFDIVDLYLQDIGRFPLLNPVEELHYSQSVQVLMQLQQVKINIAAQLQREPTTAEERVRELERQALSHLKRHRSHLHA